VVWEEKLRRPKEFWEDFEEEVMGNLVRIMIRSLQEKWPRGGRISTVTGRKSVYRG
jgi:hypothetical protein